MEIASFTLSRENDESYSFSDEGLAELPTAKGHPLPGPKVPWRVRGEWLDIDTANDGSFKRRLRAIAIDKEHEWIVAESPEGKKTVWWYTSLRFVIGMASPTALQTGGFAVRRPR